MVNFFSCICCILCSGLWNSTHSTTVESLNHLFQFSINEVISSTAFLMSTLSVWNIMLQDRSLFDNLKLYQIFLLGILVLSGGADSSYAPQLFKYFSAMIMAWADLSERSFWLQGRINWKGIKLKEIWKETKRTNYKKGKKGTTGFTFPGCLLHDIVNFKRLRW